MHHILTAWETSKLTCPNLPVFTQALLRKVWKPQREMDLEDEVFGVFGECIVFIQDKTPNPRLGRGRSRCNIRTSIAKRLM